MSDQERRDGIASHLAWQSGYAAGRAAERKAASQRDDLNRAAEQTVSGSGLVDD